jgi:conflict system pore-forming effector with SLATT domain
MFLDWYVMHRVDGQIGFYRTRGAERERSVWLLSLAGSLCAATGVALGTLAPAAKLDDLSSWMGVATMLGAMIVAYGLMERRQYLAASYAAMLAALRRLKDQMQAQGLEAPTLIAAAALMQSEHAAWARVTQTHAHHQPNHQHRAHQKVAHDEA